MAADFLPTHNNTLSLLGKSIGGRGLFDFHLGCLTLFVGHGANIFSARIHSRGRGITFIQVCNAPLSVCLSVCLSVGQMRIWQNRDKEGNIQIKGLSPPPRRRPVPPPPPPPMCCCARFDSSRIVTGSIVIYVHCPLSLSPSVRSFFHFTFFWEQRPAPPWARGGTSPLVSDLLDPIQILSCAGLEQC